MIVRAATLPQKLVTNSTTRPKFLAESVRVSGASFLPLPFAYLPPPATPTFLVALFSQYHGVRKSSQWDIPFRFGVATAFLLAPP